jgi:hypothetical protein
MARTELLVVQSRKCVDYSIGLELNGMKACNRSEDC